MIVKDFKTLEQLEEKLRAVPAEKRKVIVLVGRHPNEGTIAIANRHHRDWEKHGAVTVQLPREWTPHWIWSHAVRTKEVFDPMQYMMMVPSDTSIISFLSSRGFKVPFVNFHGTPSEPMELPDPPDVIFHVTDKSKIFLKRPIIRGFNALHDHEVSAEFFYHGDRHKGSPEIRNEVTYRYCRYVDKPNHPHTLRLDLSPAYL